MSRITLICCEGKTEELYFKILRDRIYRIPGYIKIDIQGEKGQHKALVDRTVAARAALAESEEVPVEDIDSWAVCDDDGMRISFSELEKYAADSGVNLAFAKPQFESYLLQHFEQSKVIDQQELYDQLTKYKRALGYEGEYEKSDLGWLERTLIDKPKLVDVAIINSEQRGKPSASPFLTIQELTKQLKILMRD